MLRTFAVLLLLLGLATATPVVCLCAPTEAASLSASESDSASGVVDAPSLLATSAAAVVASLVATAGGLPGAAPWQLPRPAFVRWQPSLATAQIGQSWSPAVPPPR